MVGLLHPRWMIPAAIVALILGVVGLLAGYGRIAPLGILAGQILIILAAIKLTTPDIPPHSVGEDATHSETSADVKTDVTDS